MRPHDGSHQDEEHARENVEALFSLIRGRPLPVLVDIRAAGTTSPEARRVYATEIHNTPAQAVLVDSAFTRMVAGLFVRLSRPKIPTRLFTSEEEATAWLHQFLE